MAHLLPNVRRIVKAGVSAKTLYNRGMKQMLIIALLFLPTLALAEDVPAKTVDLYPPMAGVDYFCTDADGRRLEIGQVICITASCNTWMAKCDMSLNNPMWRKVQDGCPAVSLIDRLKQSRPL